MKFNYTIFSLILFLSCFSPLWAQKGALDLGASFSWNNARVAEPTLFDASSSISGFSGMVKLEWVPVARLRASFAVGNVLKGYESQVTFRGTHGIYENVKVENQLSYVSNQITLGWLFGNKLKVIPEVGISFDALFNQVQIIDAFENIPESKTSELEYYRNWNNAVIGGISIRYPVIEKMDIGILGKFSQGLTNITVEDILIPEGKPSNLFVGAEVIWHLKQPKN